MALKSGKRFCVKPGCRKLAMRDGSGFCYSHNPEMGEKRKVSFVMRRIANNYTAPPSGRRCSFEGCQKWGMQDGSGFCYAHNPNMREKWRAAMAKRVPPSDRRCSAKGCHLWTVEDGSGFCYNHHKEALEALRIRMKGNTYTLGRHQPWLGLENIEEARGLLFYSLETDQPLLTLRALTKIASLHHLGQMTMPERPKRLEPGDEEPLEREGGPDLKTFYSGLFTTYPLKGGGLKTTNKKEAQKNRPGAACLKNGLWWR